MNPVLDDTPDIIVEPLTFPAGKQECNKVLFIDGDISEAQLFYDSAAPDVLPIIYRTTSTAKEVSDVLSNYTSISRIAFAFHDNIHDGKYFVESRKFFEASDLVTGVTTFSQGLQFLLDIITLNQVKKIDFFACNSLQYENWKSFYELLTDKTGVIVGASNDKTGNLKHGGDWVMETTNEDILNIYFSSSIENYTGTLASTISDSGIIYFRMNGGIIEYVGSSTGGVWTAVSSWPVSIVNNLFGSAIPLTVSFQTNITISNSTVGTGTNGYFNFSTPYITMEGNSNTITVDGVVNYPGLFRNGTLAVGGYGNATIQNFNFTAINGSTVGFRNGWVCFQGFGGLTFNTLVSNCNGNADIGPNTQCGFICGRAFAQGDGVSPNTSSAIVQGCTNSGTANSQSGGGILGIRTGQFGGNVIVRNCLNSGSLSAMDSVGGIVGQQAGQGGYVEINNCENTGNILCNASSGICNYYAGTASGLVVINNCINRGLLQAATTAGICTGLNYGSINNCVNFTAINGQNSGGIIGSNSTLVGISVNKCYNLGDINGTNSGGIAGNIFGNSIGQTFTISNCYNLGAVQGTSAGGICGAEVGYTNNASQVPTIVLQNCYNLGAVATSAGGLLGGTAGNVYAASPTVNVINCYNNGTIVDTGSSFDAISLPISPTFINCYAADGAWSKSNADAALTGVPTIANTPGTTWAQYALNQPYILSTFSGNLYSPSTGTVGDYYNFTTTPGLLTPGYTYADNGATNNHNTSIISSTGVLTVYGNTVSGSSTAYVTAYQGTAPNVYGYQTGSFTVNFVKVCFLRGSKILTDQGYKPVEDLRRGDLVQTYKHGRKMVAEIGWSRTYQHVNDKRGKDKLYILRNNKYPSLNEPLVITGCHSILETGFLNETEYNAAKEVNGDIYKTDDLFRLPVCVDARAELYEEEGVHEIWHLALEHDDERMNYGIYANGGLLVETTSLRMIRQFSGLTLL